MTHEGPHNEHGHGSECREGSCDTSWGAIGDGPLQGREKPSRCFIATAVYGDANASEVRALRAYRDLELSSSLIGRGFIALYYQMSPPLARYLERTPRAARIFRVVLDRIVVVVMRRLQRHFPPADSGR